MASTLIQMSFVPLVAIILTLILIIKNKTISKKITRFYLCAVVIFGLLMIVDMSDFYLSHLEKLNNMRYITSIVGYCLRPIALLLILFTLIRNDNTKKKSWILVIPALINALLCIFTPLTKWIFYFTENNDFHRGPIGLIPFIVSGIYLIVLFCAMFVHLHGIEKTELLLVLAMIVAVMIAVVIESLTSARCLLNGIGVIFTNFYFLYLNTQTYRRDELTYLLNRRSLYTDIKGITENTFVVCIDMNNLKLLNDTYGHMVGDQALKTVANALKDTIMHHGNVYRVGGDEFVILTKLSEESLKNCFKKIDKILTQNDLSIAYGYELYDGIKSFEEVYNNADEKMYSHKKEVKAQYKAMDEAQTSSIE